MSTKKELLARAKELNITGRHDMNAEQLAEAIHMEETFAPGTSHRVADTVSPEALQELKDEVAKIIDGEPKMIKVGKKLVKNTNIPWKRKFYFLNVRAYELRSEQVKKAPSQVQLMLKSMIAAEFTSAEDAQMGTTIASEAIGKGGLKTKIEPHVLFAYYRSKMEKLGLEFAGYDIDA